MNYLIVHTIGSTAGSIFALELQKEDGETVIYHVDPTESMKYNPYFDPFKIGSTLESAVEAVSEITPLSINTSGLKLLPSLDAKKITDKIAFGKTVMKPYRRPSPPVEEPIINFEMEEPTTCGNPNAKSKHGSCPFENSIVADNNVYIYPKPFSNFTKFHFKLDGFLYTSLEQLIMHLRMWTLIDEPIRLLAEERPNDIYITMYLEEMNIESIDELFKKDPKELSYETIHKSIVGNWSTNIMKKSAVARCKRYFDLATRQLEAKLIERTSKYYQHALNHKILSSPSLTYFFLIHAEHNWYEVAPINSVWVINEKFSLADRNNEEYLDDLLASAEKYGTSRNAFGKYLKKTALWIKSLE